MYQVEDYIVPSHKLYEHIKKLMLNKDEWKEYLPILRTKPNKEDLENARKFALKILKQVE